MLAKHPANLLLRFVLEIVALVACGQWAWQAAEGLTRYLFGIGLPLILAAVWGIFAVPGDPSRSGKAPVPVPGRIRLGIESAIFTLAFLSLLGTGQLVLAGFFAFAILLHYFWSAERIVWLLKQ